MRAPWRLHGAGVIDLRAVPDSIGLSPRTLAAVERIEGAVEYWCLIENRTLFDRVAEVYGDRNAVLWVLWQSIGGNRRSPACSRDVPLQHASRVIRIRRRSDRRRGWKSLAPRAATVVILGMSVELLRSLRVHRELTDEDDIILESLRARELPEDLARAAD